MNRYILIGAYIKEGRESEAKCIDTIYEGNDQLARANLADYVWEYHKENLEKYDLLFLISDSLKVIARASSFTNVEFLRVSIEEESDLSNYHPVYVDIAEHDERVLLFEILDVDFV